MLTRKSPFAQGENDRTIMLQRTGGKRAASALFLGLRDGRAARDGFFR